MKIVPHRTVRKSNPEDVQAIQAFDTESRQPGRKVLIERAVSKGNAYVVVW